jgi:hypothetical protein
VKGKKKSLSKIADSSWCQSDKEISQPPVGGDTSCHSEARRISLNLHFSPTYELYEVKMMRKIRGWAGNNEVTQVQVAKPSLPVFQLSDSIILLKWINAIGCVEGYKIYGGTSPDSLIQIGETNTNSFTKQLGIADYPYFITVSTFYGNTESEKTPVINVREKKAEKIVAEIILPEAPKQTVIQQEPVPLNKTENYPFGLCTCCLLPQPLMKRKDKIVCSRNTKQIYTQSGSKWVIQPQQIISDIEQMDELLRQNSAYVGIGGVLVNNRRF